MPRSVCMSTLNHFSLVQLFVTPWTLAVQAPLFMGFSRQEYWSGLPWPPPWDLPDLGIKPRSLMSLHWQQDSLPLVLPGKPLSQREALNSDPVSISAKVLAIWPELPQILSGVEILPTSCPKLNETKPWHTLASFSSVSHVSFSCSPEFQAQGEHMSPFHHFWTMASALEGLQYLFWFLCVFQLCGSPYSQKPPLSFFLLSPSVLFFRF